MKFIIFTLLPLCALADIRSLPVGPNPESVTRGFDGDLFVSLMGETRVRGDGNGRIVRLAGDTVSTFATGLNDPKGLVFAGGHLITADFDSVWKIDATGTRTLLAGPADFPHAPLYLNDVAVTPDGQAVLVTDMGATDKMRGADGQLWPLNSPGADALPALGRVYRIGLDGRVSLVVDHHPELPCPNGVTAPAGGEILLAEFFSGRIFTYADGKLSLLASGHRGADGVERGPDGTIYVSEVITGRVWAIAPNGHSTLLADQLSSAADFYLDNTHRQLVVPDTKAGRIVFVPLPPLNVHGIVPATPLQWSPVEFHGQLHPRHEAAFVGLGEKLYLLGGRRIQSVDCFDLATKTWSEGKAPPVETHHFQPVVWQGKIWLPGAMTGKYPHEIALDQIPVYDPATDTWSQGPALPADRQRGGAGAVIQDGKLYVICGIIDGHWSGHVAWLDVLDLKTGQWSRLPDAPRARDHFQAAVIGGKIYVAGGRRSSGATNQVFDLTVAETDVYDIARGTWSTLPVPSGNLPTPRAGSMSLAVGPLLLVGGGESINQPQDRAHDQVEALDTRTGTWSLFARFARGRHGSALVRIGDTLFVASGSGNRGGKPELETMESLTLPADLR